jgi:lipoyl(octanoyl) transferase
MARGGYLMQLGTVPYGAACELHVPESAEVEVVETNRGGKSTFHGPGQLVCYPILDLKRHGKDVKQYVRNLEEALIRTVAPLGVEAGRIDGLTGIWLNRPPRKLASIGVHVSRWVTTHGYALNVDLDPAPFTDWITACGLEDASFTTVARETGRPVTVDELRPHAVAALEEVFGLELEPLPAEDGAGLWAQPVHAGLSSR